MDLLVQTAGSLAAILALAGLAWWMKLGGTPRLESEDAVRHAAGEVEDGFDPVTWSWDAEGAGALARDAEGRIMVIRRHGNRFAGRILGPAAQAQASGGTLVVDPGERRFGTLSLALSDAQAWAAAINRIDGRQDA
ncbi:hypothetical protein [Porphyrobacter sp. CACIAM 03H1]|uniref:hypothetical protein n=1 Tax=Porphyrobacter sp. CACIAM 03H1 TaxID=2003315 RepID=UPI000B5A2519|nr:hypothetical protein [Porphyrobacter sp. CACIAM 03H1]ASJ89660.1 hypothetical protein CBR61_01045 [Porphyrobacter sp. CACIAM 03H1]